MEIYKITTQSDLQKEIQKFEKEFYEIKTLNSNFPLYSLTTYEDRNLNIVRQQGGSCPLVYALKHLDDLCLMPKQETEFWDLTRDKLKKVKEDLYNKKGQSFFSKELCSNLVIITLPSNNFLNQKFLSVFKEIFNLKIINYEGKEKTFYHLDLNLFNKINSIKHLPLEQRKNLKVLELNENIKSNFENYKNFIQNRNILILDDLVASGRTMLNAYELLKQFQPKEIIGLSIFARKDL